MDEEQKGFKVTDRRIHGDDEEPSAADDTAGAAEPDAGADSTDDDDPDGGSDQSEVRYRSSPPIPMSFATFVVSLGESAWIHLGLVPNPMTNEREIDLVMARQTIDILGILEDKTRGNLDDEEDKLMRNLLYTLRLHFVQVEAESKRKG